ncbi:RNA-directed DNA polymerase, eukaryota [Tanacetum coccineum]
MFAFCRFIKVSNSKTLIDSLSNVWIGKLRLYANVAKFDRKSVVNRSRVDVKIDTKTPDQSQSFSNKVNSYAYVTKTFKHDDLVVEERLVWELCSWTPNFVSEDSDSDNENFMDKDFQVEENDFEDRQPKAEETSAKSYNPSMGDAYPITIEPVGSDPFGLGPLINKTWGNVKNSTSLDTLTHLPGFSPNSKADQNTITDFPPGFSPLKNLHDNQNNPTASTESVSSGDPGKYVGFSMLERLQETIKVGVALGLNMDGCESTLAALIANNGDIKETKMLHVDLWTLHQAWGNTQFDFSSTSARVAAGDFNEVWEAEERFGSTFNKRQADFFNSLISGASLIDVPLGGYKYTWSDKWGSKMSKLDRFLVSKSLYEIFPSITGLILEKGVPDHRPILIKEHEVDFGPTPFRFFHSWLELEGFHSMVVDTWKNDGIVEFNRLISFKKKLQNLKKDIRAWIGTNKSDSLKIRNDHLARLSSIDFKIDQGIANESDFQQRRDSIHILGNLDKREASDKRFQTPDGFLATYVADMLNKLSNNQADLLERNISNDEIKKVVLDCGNDRAPGPDGFTFKFFSTFWDLIEPDVIGSCKSPEQSAFIKGRNILDGPLVLNEVMAWSQKCYLLNGRASVLVNGSPTKEFVITRGLRQGDPLSPFLFILAMEGLHAFICKAINMGMYKGITIGNNLHISHLVYAGDVILIGELTSLNAHKLLCILRCFYLVSGLKINVLKSNLYGLCVSNEETSVMAKDIGCAAAKLPFKYLGFPVDSRLLSIRGRYTLVKVVLGSLPLYFMSLYKAPTSICKKLESLRNQFFSGADLGEKKLSWVRWNKCLASKDLGGLGIRSIIGLNARLLFKWIWRFLHNSDDLWIKVIKILHGHNGGISENTSHRLSLSPWCGILSSIKALKFKGIDLLSLCSRKVGNGASIRFWEEIWHGNLPLKSLFLRIYLLDNDRGCNIANRVSLQNWNLVLRRPPRGGIKASQFDELQRLIQTLTLSDQVDS